MTERRQLVVGILIAIVAAYVIIGTGLPLIGIIIEDIQQR